MDKSELSELISSSLEDAKRLMELQVKLLKMELACLNARIKRMALLLMLSVLILLPVSVLLFLAMSLGLQEWIDAPLWACHLIVSATGVGVVLLLAWRIQRIWINSEKEENYEYQYGNRNEQKTITAPDFGNHPVAQN